MEIMGINKTLNDTVIEANLVTQKTLNRRNNSAYFSNEPISKKTEYEYQTVFKRLEKLASESIGINKLDSIYKASAIIEIARTTKTKATWFKRKAAIFFCVKSRIDDQINIPLERINQSLLDRDTEIINLLETLQPPYSDSQSESKKTFFKRSGLRSKKNLLKYLPEGWRDQIFEKLNFRGCQEEEFLTLAISGCRPIELENGVYWELDQRGMTATILGAKRKAFSGQKFRKLTFLVNSKITKRFAQIVAECGGKLFVQIKDKKDISTHLAEIGRRIFPNLKSNLTSYVFRHQFAADIKYQLSQPDCKISLEDLAGALGHSTNEMQRIYGHLKQSKGGMVDLIKVEVERPVKIKKIEALSKRPSTIKTKAQPKFT
jgi:hypothetical protein